MGFGSSGPVTDVPINISASGDNNVLAALAGYKGKLLSVVLEAATAVNVTMGSGLAGAFVAGIGILPVPATPAVPLVLLLNEDGWYTGGAGLPMNFKLSGAVAVTGVAKFQQVL